jgi:hypothetical protein
MTPELSITENEGRGRKQKMPPKRSSPRTAKKIQNIGP